MIKKVTVTNHLGESIEFELRFPEKSGFLIRGGIQGLDPGKANINTTEMATVDGSVFNSARKTKRNVVFNLGFLDKPTIEDTRQLSYKYFPLDRRIKMEVETTNRICETYGYVESNEVDIFSEEEGSVISVICLDPNLYSVNKSVTLFSSTESLFEFPFSSDTTIESVSTIGMAMGVLGLTYAEEEQLTITGMAMGVLGLTYAGEEEEEEEEPLEGTIEFGDITGLTVNNIIYTGDVPVGITIYIHALGQASNIEISNIRTRGIISLDSTKLQSLTGGIVDGDDIIISTVKGNKFASLQRNGVIYNIFNALNRDRTWFQLEKGDNLFSYTADEGIENLQIRVENQIAYEGI